jgi:uncharacterized protein (DUF305 family)
MVAYVFIYGEFMKLLEISSKKLAAIMAVSVLALPGITHAQANAAGGDAQKMTMPMANSSSMQGMDLMTTMTKMRTQMDAVKMTGNMDEDFAMMMRTHHQGAIDMAKIELKSGKDPELRKMAQKMINDQTKEIAKLDKWMEKKGHTMK